MAKRMDLDKNIHPGKYRINTGMNNRQIILMLKNNKQEKVKLTFNSQIRTKEEFIEYLVSKLELNFEELDEYLSDDVVLEKEYGIPNLWPYLYIDRVLMNGQLVREYPYNKTTLSHEDMMRRGHCKERGCVMRFSADAHADDFCPRCKEDLAAAGGRS